MAENDEYQLPDDNFSKKDDELTPSANKQKQESMNVP